MNIVKVSKKKKKREIFINELISKENGVWIWRKNVFQFKRTFLSLFIRKDEYLAHEFYF